MADSRPRTRLPGIFLLCWIAYCTSYVGRLAYSASMPRLIELGIGTPTQIGIVNSAFFLCYGFGQFVNGQISDHASPRVMISLGLAGSGVANLAMSFLSNWKIMCAVWTANAFFQSMLWTSIMKIFGSQLSVEEGRRAGVGITSSFAVGSIISYFFSSLMLAFFSWRETFIAASLFLLPVGIAFLAAYPHFLRTPRNDTERATEKAETEVPFRTAVIAGGAVFCLLPAACFAFIKDGVGVWTPAFLVQNYGLRASTASFATLLEPLVNLSGAYMAQALWERMGQNELKAASVFFLAAAVILSLVLLIPGLPSFAVLLLLSFATATAFAENTLVLNLASLRFARSGHVGSVSGLCNSVGCLGSSLGSFGTGAMMERSGWRGANIIWILAALTGFAATFGARKKKLGA